MVSALLPRARQEGLVIEEVAGETLVYDLERHRAHCLNRTAALIWQRCDGQTTMAEMLRLLRENEAPAAEELVQHALQELDRLRLLAACPPAWAQGKRMSRRALLRKLGLATAVSVPLITSIVAPTAAQAASCLPSGAACGEGIQCCSNLCPNGTCT